MAQAGACSYKADVEMLSTQTNTSLFPGLKRPGISVAFEDVNNYSQEVDLFNSLSPFKALNVDMFNHTNTEQHLLVQ